MTENAEQVEQTEDTRTPEQVEMDRLRAECEVWHDRCTRVNKEYSRYREDARESIKLNDQTIENLNSKIQAQQHHLEVHHRQDVRHATEMERMKAKLDSYSSLLSLLADAGRIHPDLLDQIDAGISTLHDAEDELPQVKFFTGKNAQEAMRSFLSELGAEMASEDEDDEEYVTPRTMRESGGSMPEYEPGPDEQKVVLTDAGLPKRPVKDKPQPGNDWADNDPEAPWNR